ncbi:hypothetical protein PIB30_051446 [Stylosanthes scabra]|uniref:Uncharacterized protein n=1 Tax=Stylosanthes scabra TaxID=79078 RepID=A0ABU6SHQ9_9FABA|nr:hypothetical protein [Stylosanthes scabra]
MMVLEFGTFAEIFELSGFSSQPASSSCAETRTVNLINDTGLMSWGLKRSENEAENELRVDSRIDSELLLNQLWHYSPPPSSGHNFPTKTPIDAPFAATRSSLHPLCFYPTIEV